MRLYARWSATVGGTLRVDLVDTKHPIEVNALEGLVLLDGDPLTPDAARLIGVRLIEGATLADGLRSARAAPETRRAS